MVDKDEQGEWKFAVGDKVDITAAYSVSTNKDGSKTVTPYVKGGTAVLHGRRNAHQPQEMVLPLSYEANCNQSSFEKTFDRNRVPPAVCPGLRLGKQGRAGLRHHRICRHRI